MHPFLIKGNVFTESRTTRFGKKLAINNFTFVEMDKPTFMSPFGSNRTLRKNYVDIIELKVKKHQKFIDDNQNEIIMLPQLIKIHTLINEAFRYNSQRFKKASENVELEKKHKINIHLEACKTSYKNLISDVKRRMLEAQKFMSPYEFYEFSNQAISCISSMHVWTSIISSNILNYDNNIINMLSETPNIIKQMGFLRWKSNKLEELLKERLWKELLSFEANENWKKYRKTINIEENNREKEEEEGEEGEKIKT
jgi:hypothetical protein